MKVGVLSLSADDGDKTMCKCLLHKQTGPAQWILQAAPDDSFGEGEGGDEDKGQM